MKTRQPGWGNIPWLKLWDAMKECPQSEGQSVWQHGESVVAHLQDLVAYLRGEKVLEGWRLPEWVDEYKDQLLASIEHEWSIYTYAMYHDCGKPFCRVVDAEGKQHFPDHAKVSRAKYLEVAAGMERTQEIADLIAHDMDIHIIKADGVDKFCELKGATTLLLCGLAEIHSNAQLFGGEKGIESTSFKIKWKQISKRGNQVCQRLFVTV